MKRICNFSIFLLLLFVFSTKAKAGQELTILFTHDLHDHIEEFKVYEQGQVLKKGGYERLYQEIERHRKDEETTFLLDAGDFSMGTLFQTIYDTESPSLKLLGKMGYDGVTLGNHEWDFRKDGLIKSLDAVALGEGPKAPLVVSNVVLDEELQRAFHRYGVEEYKIIEKSGLRIGLFGLLGWEAISNAPMAGVEFKDPIETAREIVGKLEEEKVDLIVLLSHTGTHEDSKKSEDHKIAEKVPGIDIIISGHSHTKLEEPLEVNNTWIFSSGYYGHFLGKAVVEKTEDGVDILEYENISLIGEVLEKRLTEDISYYKNKVQQDYLNPFGLEYDEVLAYSPFSFTSSKEIFQELKEEPLANLIADAFLEKAKKIDSEIIFSVVPSGTVRDSIVEGPVTVSDVFNVNSLGVGPDGVSGYPLVKVYIEGRDVKNIAEVDASIGDMMPTMAQLFTSGLEYEINPKRIIFNKVTDVYLLDQKGRRMEIEDDKLYPMVAGLYSGQMLGIVESESKGILKVRPRDSEGLIIENLEEHILREDGKEIKEWLAVAEFLSEQEVGERGLPEIPEKYEKAEGRKVIEEDSSFSGRFGKSRIFSKLLYLAVFLLLIGFLFLGFVLYRKVKSRKKRKIRQERREESFE